MLSDLAGHLIHPHGGVTCCRYNSCALQGEWKETSDRNLKASYLLSLITTDKTLKALSCLAKVEYRWSDSHNNFCLCLEMKLIKKKKKIDGERKKEKPSHLLAGKWGVIYCILTFG